MTLKQAAIENLRDAKGIFDSLGIPFWIDSGTLLGAYRDHDFCKGDEDDIDIGTWTEFQTDEIIRRAQALGFRRLDSWKTQFHLHRNGSLIDILFLSKNKGMAYSRGYRTYEDHVGYPFVVPVHFFEELTTIEFQGMTFKCPADIDGYLTYRFGNWRVPVGSADYRYYDPKCNRAVQPDWKP